MQRVFLDQNGRLRSGWRAAAFLISFLLIASGLIFTSVVALSQMDLGETATGLLPISIPFVISTVIALLLGWVCLRLFEGLPFKALGAAFTNGWARNLAAGVLLGGVAFGSAALIGVMSRGLELHANTLSTPRAIISTLWTTFLIFLVGAASEETLFRGYLMQTLARGPIKWFAIALTASLFALAHNANPDISGLSIFNTLLAGVWFGIAYLKTRDLWFPFGLHFMWNWLQGPIFGINVSGISTFSPDPVLRATDHGPAWLTGGAYGLEGGIACTIAILISIGLIHFLPILKPTPEMLDLSEARLPSGS
ncbi:MAG: CPBP family intramembrane metalloprotease [Acidobacteria bacterium]|nr:CPBP family intramembrane metalloprotease [Acidobacteriota bacterium]